MLLLSGVEDERSSSSSSNSTGLKVPRPVEDPELKFIGKLFAASIVGEAIFLT